MRLNGWQRIWVVASALWVAAVLGRFALDYPSRATDGMVATALFGLSPDTFGVCASRNIPAGGDVVVVDVGGGQSMNCLRSYALDVDGGGAGQVRQMAASVREAVPRVLAREQRWHVFAGAVFAAVPPALAYACGLVVAWVLRDFRVRPA